MGGSHFASVYPGKICLEIERYVKRSRKMRIVLAQPPNLQRSGDWNKMKVSRPPINLALLASYLRKFGHEPFIYDFDWFEGGVDEISALILAQNPEVVGFTCLTPRIEITLDIAAKIKKLNPG